MPAREPSGKDEVVKNSKTKEIIVKTRVVPGVVPKHVTGFAEFLREYGVVGLAVGFIFGTQVKSVVDQLTASFINPLLGVILPGNGDLSHKTSVIHFNGKATAFAWGAFVTTFISFLIVATIVYLIVKAMHLDKLKPEKS